MILSNKRFTHFLRICFLLLFLSIISTFLYVLPSYAAFSLDTTYGNGGKVITSFGMYADAQDVALQSDGKAVVVGYNYNGSANWVIARYNTDGTLDTSFGTNGIVIHNFGFSNTANAVRIQPDGKIVVAGGDQASPTLPWTVGRFNTDGSLDTTFGNNGIATPSINAGGDGRTSIMALMLQSDNKIVTAGYTGTSPDIIAVRQNSDGSLDQTFGSGGIVIAQLAGSPILRVRSATLQPDGKIVIFGNSNDGGVYTYRINADGSTDTTFGTNGQVTENFGGDTGYHSITIQSDGKIVETGGYGSPTRTFVIRYNSDGTLDNNFGSGGLVLNPFATIDSSDFADSVLIQSDGKIVLGGGSYDGSTSSFALRRLNTDSTLDASFGNNGSIITPIGSGGSSVIYSISLQTNGSILAVGAASNGSYDDFALARYLDVPNVGAITAPSSPVLVNSAITASANFTDPDSTGTHTASWNWGDGNTTTGTVTESNGSGSVSNTHTYTTTGVYTITLSVTNANGGTGSSTYQYVAVYDSTTSFAGGRSFDNPSSASPNTTGKVSYGISSKYNNSNVLTGNVKMNFKAASIDFVSTSLSSLATSNGKAYLKGNGTVNGSGNYTFLATGIDGSVVGGNDLIRFQIKDASNNVVYDSQPGAGDTTDPTTVVATGNIRVH